MEQIVIAVFAILFVFAGMKRVTQTDEMKAVVEDLKDNANANAEKAMSEVNTLMEEEKERRWQMQWTGRRKKAKQPERESQARRKNSESRQSICS